MAHPSELWNVKRPTNAADEEIHPGAGEYRRRQEAAVAVEPEIEACDGSGRARRGHGVGEDRHPMNASMIR
jgi:hypothetical protein